MQPETSLQKDTKKIVGLLILALAGFFAYVATLPDEFRVMRTKAMDAPIPKVFSIITNLHQWQEFSPWYKMDPAAKVEFEDKGGVGDSMSWDSKNDQVGVGKMTITDIKPNEAVDFKLEFKKPFEGQSESNFRFRTEDGRTLVKWVMVGKRNFIMKLMSIFMNCDKTVGDQFEQGLGDLKTVAEAKK